MEIVNIDKIKNLILEIRDEKVILDSDVAELYGVATKRINEAVKNNPDKFPSGYIIELSKIELELFCGRKFRPQNYLKPDLLLRLLLKKVYICSLQY